MDNKGGVHMAEVLLICGKICSGKSYLSRQLVTEKQAVILSVDEITRTLFPEGLGDRHDEFTALVRAYLLKKAGEIVRAGSNVIIDWGFWTRAMRGEAREALAGVPCKWYYLDIPDDRWAENIRRRNEHANDPGSLDYFVDEGLKEKCLSLFEAPTEDEIDVWLR